MRNIFVQMHNKVNKNFIVQKYIFFLRGKALIEQTGVEGVTYECVCVCRWAICMTGC